MNQKIKEQTNRTTKILLVILVLFIMGEVPNGVALCLTAYYGPEFYWKYYYYAMEVFNSLTHITAACNFVIYYSLSNQFRATFKELFTHVNEETSNSKLSTQTPRSSLAEISKSSMLALGCIFNASQQDLVTQPNLDTHV